MVVWRPKIWIIYLCIVTWCWISILASTHSYGYKQDNVCHGTLSVTEKNVYINGQHVGKLALQLDIILNR